jgi:hypothetical protein
MTSLHLESGTRENVGFSDVEAALRALDGSTATLVVIAAASGQTLTVGGGPALFVAEVAVSDTERWCIIDPGRPKGIVYLTVGGQLGDFPALLCVGIAPVMRAARAFVLDGQRATSVDWSQET